MKQTSSKVVEIQYGANCVEEDIDGNNTTLRFLDNEVGTVEKITAASTKFSQCLLIFSNLK